MTPSEWEAELRSLHADLGSTQRMKLRWRLSTPIVDGRSGLDLLTGRSSEDESLFLALYPESARAGERPIVEVEDRPNADIRQVPQGRIVDVAGLPTPGHAAVVIIDGREY